MNEQSYNPENKKKFSKEFLEKQELLNTSFYPNREIAKRVEGEYFRKIYDKNHLSVREEYNFLIFENFEKHQKIIIHVRNLNFEAELKEAEEIFNGWLNN